MRQLLPAPNLLPFSLPHGILEAILAAVLEATDHLLSLNRHAEAHMAFSGSWSKAGCVCSSRCAGAKGRGPDPRFGELLLVCSHLVVWDVRVGKRGREGEEPLRAATFPGEAPPGAGRSLQGAPLRQAGPVSP